MSIIKVEDVKKRYGENYALRGLDLEIKKGEIYGFLGPNGAGKSTAIKTILGLVKPDDGSIEVDGKDASEGNIEVRKSIGYLPEKIEMYSGLTVQENLKFLCELKGCPEDVEPNPNNGILGFFVSQEDGEDYFICDYCAERLNVRGIMPMDAKPVWDDQADQVKDETCAGCQSSGWNR